MTWVAFQLTVVAAVGGAALATAAKLPAGPLLGAMIGVAALRLTTDMSFNVPSIGRWAIYCAVGALLGQTVTKEVFTELKSAVVPIVLVVVLFIIFGFVLAWGLWRFAGFDGQTALLATAPGGIAQMGVLSVDAKANVGIVLAIHVLRISSVIILMTVGLKFLGGRT